ncbi:glucose-1-phosphate adenylyltransferase subunit GlgD [Propionispora hippei]|uniref:Glucose-1-phosphate adenylyltransferase n=1 Tax=Propionispora hippei DSM 15287 TaxID=1123003 RepID=A0A1M6BHV6_9FIRM|nr:glucose-1-phosphate adenylyltransferase subunit GlgD [Propionispora hippei]SHI48360.1 glucose-1-phosphate adenylyltransferase [Propionispora hippei DSM 15287]
MDAMGIINLNDPDGYIHELTQYRPPAGVPFGGRYRLIDFPLSNLVNSGITNVGILIQHKYRSLMDHLRSGKEWDLARKRDGLFLLPPATSAYPGEVHRGDVENFLSNMDYLIRNRQKYVVISGAITVCNMNYRQVIDYHEKRGADITIIYSEKDCSEEDASQSLMVEVDQDRRVVDMQVKPHVSHNKKLCMEMFVMEKKLLISLIRDCVSHGDYDFIKHCIIKNIGNLNMCGYPYNGYVARIHSLQSYYKHNMDLLKPEVWQELFFREGFIYTKVKDEPPSQYFESAETSNSLVSGGCRIAGKVENSILFRGVKVAEGAYVKNSIIMQKCEIAAGTVLENVVCDKDVQVAAGKHLRGDAHYPFVIKKGMVI